jgi:histidinol-phosphate/aromatic aminotransferase/cobyric acid decarboxylase-like protein
MERTAPNSDNLVVCKSLSKVYALSGARAAYLCGPPRLMRLLRKRTPPWAVSLPAQVAAVAALRDPGYYQQCYAETAELRSGLEVALQNAIPGLKVLGSAANFILCELPPNGPDARVVIERCRRVDVFLRDAGRTTALLGTHTIRIAVKAADTNRRIVETLAAVVSCERS